MNIPKILKKNFLTIIDLALFTVGLLMIVTDQTVMLFHIVFVLLSVGAFYWTFRHFALRAGVWVTIDSLYVLQAVRIGKTQVDELIEIPLLTIILLTVFFIAKQRADAEQKARFLNTELAQRVVELDNTNRALAEYAQKLQQTQAQLVQEEKMSALGHLVAGVAHEINNPLGAIQSLICNVIAAFEQIQKELPPLFQTLSPKQLGDFFALVDQSKATRGLLSFREERQLKRNLSKNLSEQEINDADQLANSLSQMGIAPPLDAYMSLLNDSQNLSIVNTANWVGMIQNSNQHIQLAVDRASRIVFALKNYVRQDAGGVKIKANITDGIETVLTIYHHQLKQGIEVKKIYEDVQEVLCYPDELTQVWSNLIGNAIQAMNYKGQLTISVRGQAEQVLVEVQDTGTGVPAEIKGKIFEPFFTTKPAGEGSGLGLHIVRQIVEKHQGKIDVETQPGHTTFKVLLPIT